MNRRAIVLTISAVTIAGFIAAAVLYQRFSAPQETQAVTQASSSLVRFQRQPLGQSRRRSPSSSSSTHRAKAAGRSSPT
jgi:hypothetical protein